VSNVARAIILTFLKDLAGSAEIRFHDDMHNKSVRKRTHRSVTMLSKRGRGTVAAEPTDSDLSGKVGVRTRIQTESKPFTTIFVFDSAVKWTMLAELFENLPTTSK
jgi:hypothetical protein